MRDDRGQMQTIEGIAAAFITVFVLVVIVQSTSITPLSSSFTNQHIKLELQNMGNDILTTLDQTRVINTTDPAAVSLLKKSIVDWGMFKGYNMYTWNNTSYVCINDENYTSLDTALSRTLQFALINSGIAFNVEVSYPHTDGYIRTTKMIWNGDPSENSVTVSRFVTLYDSDGPDSNLVLPDISPGTDLRSTVEVRLTLWVM
jgi:hypothetical protein